MSEKFLESMNEEQRKLFPGFSVTENGAVGYKTSGKALLDMNFMLSSMRTMPESKIWDYFLRSYNENKVFAVLWLFFARDITQGCGERRVFRAIMPRLAIENPNLVVNLLKLIPEYGRWDDLIDLWDKTSQKSVKDSALEIIYSQFRDDLYGACDHRQISLLAKWMPSINTSSRYTVARATRLANALGLTPRLYRKRLSFVRNYLKVVERDMSANNWDSINYEAVPSKAALTYRNAFFRHDMERYSEYLDQVSSGVKQIHSGTLYPYEIVHAYLKDGFSNSIILDETLEAQWKALPNTVAEGKSTLVVVDGSGSMLQEIGRGATATALDVAQSLGIYFAERLTGPFKDHFITFSSRPSLVYLDSDLSLASKLRVMGDYSDYTNTDIEKTFDLILKTAVKNHLSQDDLPANLLIISDMEFDALSEVFDYSEFRHRTVEMTPLFDAIRSKFESYGYKLPRLVFWNVMSRTGTIPVSENSNGVALVSGFSSNIADMIMSGEIDPWKCLVDKLLGERYQAVIGAWMKSEG